MGPMILKEMKYKLHYNDIRGDGLPPPRGTNTRLQCSKINVKRIAFGNKEQTTSLGFIETLHKQ